MRSGLTYANVMVALIGVCVAALPAPASAAVLPGTCVGTANVTATYGPGAVGTTRTIHQQYTGADRLCHMPDPTATSATESGTATGTFNCFGLPTGDVTGHDTFTWSNGQQSVLEYHDTVIGVFGDTQGTFTSGEFKGMHVHYQGFAIPTPLNPCLLPQGGTFDFGYAGLASFG